ncbi:MAG: hypothetical protein ACKVX7_18215 [Planctomycetota bacterium]
MRHQTTASFQNPLAHPDGDDGVSKIEGILCYLYRTQAKFSLTHQIEARRATCSAMIRAVYQLS